ncbi:competence protein ComK [Cytobacillus sp. FJAT-54145]|uniref:Competence protein ComK n=1 Tax=Cytobacillus spartinae TaxID=3299023 RepID=A0ABW6KAL0_9BACI
MLMKLTTVLKPESMVILPEYNQNGLLCSKVYDVNDSYVFENSPMNIIKNTLLYFLNDLETAIRGSKSILGSYKMLPIVICDNLRMYWFPSHSPFNRNCIWFSLIHIDDIKPINKSRCLVIFKNGLLIEVNMSAKRLMHKRDLASTLKLKIEERKQAAESHHLLEMGLMYIRELNERYFTTNKSKYHMEQKEDGME